MGKALDATPSPIERVRPELAAARRGGAPKPQTARDSAMSRLVAALSTLILTTVSLAAAEPPNCTSGRFLVHGAPLVTGASQTGPDAVTLSPAAVGVGSLQACSPPRVRRVREARQTVLRVTWRNCPERGTVVRLRARIDDASCSTLRGVLTRRSGKRKTRRRFVAERAMGIVGAESTDSRTVQVTFTEPLPPGPIDASFFSVSSDLPVLSVAVTESRTQARLTTQPQVAGEVYTLTVHDMRELGASPLDPAASSATFVGAYSPDVAGALPRVVGAVSTGNTRVLVQFSKPMSDDVLSASHYAIVQQNVHPEVGVLVVLDARFLAPERRTTVELTTLSQSEVTYQVTAVNVTDVAGNPLAPATVVGNQRIDPATATFPGTPPSVLALTDSDGDGLTDDVEQRGRVIRITRVGGAVDELQVTSNPFNADTDGDGLSDAEEWAIGSNPRRADSDGDRTPDAREVNFLYSDPTKADTDDDGIDDTLEVEFFKTNLLLADSDGDGFADGDELFEMNRNPRIADLPRQEIRVGDVNLQLDERITVETQNGESRSEEITTSTSFEASREQTKNSSAQEVHGFTLEGNFRFGSSDQEKELPFAQLSLTGRTDHSWTTSTTSESKQASQEAYQTALARSVQQEASTAVTREVTGASIDAAVTVHNIGDVAFSITNLELSAMATDPENRDRLVPVATLLPRSGNPTLTLGPSVGARGPIVFSSSEVFPRVVEDLIRSPRELVFSLANYDLVDEFGRNFAFSTQIARDRTGGIVIDYGDGAIERHFVATNPAIGGRCAATAGVPGAICTSDDDCPSRSCEPFVYGRCDAASSNAGVVCAINAECPGGSCQPFVEGGPPMVGGFDDRGRPLGIPLDFAFQDILGLPKNPTGDDAILAGRNGKAETIAEGDDVQLVFGGVDGLPEDTIVVAAGENGVLDTRPGGDDTPAVTRGYETARTCSADTPAVILAGENGRVDTLAAAGDRQAVAFGIGGLAAHRVVVASDPTGTTDAFIDTAPAGDDVYFGPGTPCRIDADCRIAEPASCAPGHCTCTGRETLVRFKHRRRGAFGRLWAFLLPDDRQFGLDFGSIRLRPSETLAMVFVQDLDRDQVIARKEALFGSSDTLQDTDGDGLDDFSEIEIGWEVGTLDGSPIRRVFPDPTRTDSDRDGLLDPDEQDNRRIRCECAGSSAAGASCTADQQCGGGWCVDVLTQPAMCDYDPVHGYASCPSCPSQPIRTDPRRRDTDLDGVDDLDEVTGFLTGQGIVEPAGVIVAGSNRVADSMACPTQVCLGGANSGDPCRRERDCAETTCLNGVCNGGPDDGLACSSDADCGDAYCHRNGAARVCVGGPNAGTACARDDGCPGGSCEGSGTCVGGERAGDSCQSDADCPSERLGLGATCNVTGCDDVQVVPVGQRGLDPRAVVVGPGRDGQITSTPHGDDVSVPGGNLRADTTAAPQDRQAARPGDAVTAGQAIVKPGFDGFLDTKPAGDDVAFVGPSFKITSPLNPDSDFDQVGDGVERLLGSDPTDPRDAGNVADRDQDGLTDDEEGLVGWTALGQPVFSNPNLPDTDLDGLPDFVERALRTDPRAADTDGDGLSDFDELSAEVLGQFKLFEQFFRGFVLAIDESAQIGTDPTRKDTDGDGLTDYEETGPGVVFQVPGTGTIRRVQTDPLNPDSDWDGLDDGDEAAHGTDPSNSDSDGDGRPDGKEVMAGTKPLVPDAKVTVTYTMIDFRGGPGDGGNEIPEWYWRLYVQVPDQEGPAPEARVFPGKLVAAPLHGCPPELPVRFNAYGSPEGECLWCADKYATEDSPPEFIERLLHVKNVDVTINRSYSFTLEAGQSFVLHGEVGDLDGLPDGHGYCFRGCTMNFRADFSYATLRTAGFVTRDFDMRSAEAVGGGGEKCAASVFVEIKVD
jgi:hypothetical protein